jgi:hypothetical protein
VDGNPSAWHREVAQVGFVGRDAGVEVIEADGWEEVVGAVAVGEASRGLWLLPKAEARVRSSRVGKVGIARGGSRQEGTSCSTCRGGSAHITRRNPVLQIAISKC